MAESKHPPFDDGAADVEGDITTDMGSASIIAPASQEYWSPGSRLVSRSPTKASVRRSTARSSGLLLAAAILLLAALIAVGLWLVAVWARADDQGNELEATAALVDTRVRDGAFA